MAFKNGLSERLDELRFSSPRSPPTESTFPSYSPLSPSQSSLISAFQRPSNDVRANLQRRFTTDASKLSSWSFLNQQTPQLPDSLDILSSVSSPPGYHTMEGGYRHMARFGVLMVARLLGRLSPAFNLSRLASSTSVHLK